MTSRGERAERSTDVARARIHGDWRAQFLLPSAIWASSFLFIKVLGKR